MEATILYYLEAYLLTNEEFIEPHQVEELKRAIEFQRQRTLAE